ncbi:uncharacterized protein LOC131982366 isoform X2 [Centropristis striata]|uniref:uncharacterized protein LOC131982366 isoform X2 n=1 Tax=Centropristis striata TaxID=184440 RepID=UPI0027DF2D0E|nr:uncharacterized protein LOC131982366 isoform X2 [Centropristis striata]
MSTELYRASQPGGNDASVQGTTVGGSKPLHRFLKGQPKIIGIIKLVVGSSMFIDSIAMSLDYPVRGMMIIIPPGFLVGTLFIICGILYILTEHNPTKKTVTISLALSIVTILAALWTVLHIGITVGEGDDFRSYELMEDNVTEIDDPNWSPFETMVIAMELVFLFYTVVGGIIVIVMTCLAVAALRSSKSEAIIVMTTAASETPAD